MSERCLYCYLPLEKSETDFHVKCCIRFFGVPQPPRLDLDKRGLEKLAKEIIIRSIAVTGVQPKLSLTLETKSGDNKNSRLTIVGAMGGNFILKPSSGDFPCLPENEDLTMHLSKLVGIKTAEHSLMRIKSGELAYITKRFDRVNGEKLHCEDLCQLTESLTEQKYKGSMEKVGKAIKGFSSYPMLDALSFFEITLFSFITGNADMHMKNFSILKDFKNNYMLAPCYDLLSTKLALPKDTEEMALTINGKKNKITKEDFNSLGENLGLDKKQVERVYDKIVTSKNALLAFIKMSFLPAEMKTEYTDLLKNRMKIFR